MIVSEYFIPLLGSFLAGFDDILFWCLAFAMVMATPKILWSIFEGY